MNQIYKPLLTTLIITILFGSQMPMATVAQSTTSNCITDAVIQSGDTLGRIASRYLGSIERYPEIIEATNAQAATDSSYATITNANVVLVGWKLCIPGTSSTASITASIPSTPTPTVQSRPAATSVPTTQPASPPTAVPTQRPTSTPTSIPTATVQPTATRDPDALDVSVMRELSIDTMRRRGYPGSDFTFHQTLNPGSNYSRYLVSYQSDGLKIYSLLTVPNGVQPESGWPVIIFNHGYIPPEVYRTTERYIAYVDGFARNGYIVLRSDYRGHGFSEGEAESAYRTPDYSVDVLNAVGSIRRYAKADVNRIGMWGHSMGGYITLRSMVVDSQIKAGVIWAGTAVSYEDLLLNWTRPSWSPWRELAERWRVASFAEFGTPDENPGFWDSISANTYVADLGGPLQLHHGTADYDVPVSFSSILYSEVQAVGGEVEYYSYPGDDHNLSGYFTSAMNRSIAFFDEHVKNLYE